MDENWGTPHLWKAPWTSFPAKWDAQLRTCTLWSSHVAGKSQKYQNGGLRLEKSSTNVETITVPSFPSHQSFPTPPTSESICRKALRDAGRLRVLLSKSAGGSRSVP